MLERLQRSVDARKSGNKLRRLTFPDFDLNTDFSSNDYIGFSRNRNLFDRIRDRYDSFVENVKVGSPVLGSTGSRLLTGNFPIYHNVEQNIATYHGYNYCLLANSGWDLNYGLLSSISSEDTCILYDELSHNSLIVGAKSGRQRNAVSFKHNDTSDLMRKLKLNSKFKEKLVVVESIYSMDGDECPLVELFELVSEEGALVLVDEAHSTGIYGAKGEGLVSSLGLNHHQNLLGTVHTYGKAMGQHGAALVTNHEVVQTYLTNYSRPFIYSTALPIHSVLAIDEAYKILEEVYTPQREILSTLVSHFRRVSSELELPMLPGSDNSPIQGILIPTNNEVMRVARALMSQGFLCYPIRAPTVPEGMERIRVVLHTHNTSKEIDALCHQMQSLLQN